MRLLTLTHQHFCKRSFESIINIRPSANNRSMQIQDLELRQKIEKIIRSFLEGVEIQWE
ncbi:MAG: DUF5674 family protein [Cyanobacteria bacterium J06656_5]